MAKFEINSLDDIYEKLKDPEINLSTKFPYSHKTKTKNRSINLSLGRIWINTLLPDDFRFVNEVVDKSKMNEIIQELVEKYSPDVACDTISNIQQEAFKLSTIDPRSFRIDAFTPSEEWKAKKEEFVKVAKTLSNDEFLKASRKLADELMNELNEKGIPVQDYMNSGTKGSVSDWQSLLVSRGFVIDVEDNVSRIIPSENDGKSIEDYYKTGAQGRRNYFVRSNLTSQPGYLARRITMASANMKVTAKDCKTRKTLDLFIEKNKAANFVGRYYKDGTDIKLITDPKQVANKTIKLRSPLYCIQKDGICEVCYGQLSNKLENKNVGILAGGAINNETINALMKMRHKASQVDFIDVDFTKLKNKFDLPPETLPMILKIDKTEITAKTDLIIRIDKKDYREESFTELGNKFVLPGILEVCIGEGQNMKFFDISLGFDVNLYKPENISVDRTITTLQYTEGEKILSKDTYIKEVNIGMIDRLFEGGLKYINSPKILLDLLSQELPKTDSIHLEVVISNMFRSKDDLTVPGRLVNYKNVKVYGMKKLPFISSWLSALIFEDINKAIKTGLVENKDAEFDPIEKIVMERHFGDEAKI